MKIPSNLSHLSFVRVLRGSKKPFEKGWQKNPLTYKEAQEWLDRNGNYGILGGWNNTITIDIDRKDPGAAEIIERFRQYLPDTFTTLTPSTGEHLHYCCEDWDGNYNIEHNGIHLGECRHWGLQTLGPGSIHPDYKKPYITKLDIPITDIEARILLSILGDYLKRKPIKEIKKRWDGGQNVDITPMLKTGKYKQNGNKFTGSHPGHGSSTGGNFEIDTEKNAWYCFRHNSGGGILSLIAVLEGTIKCEEAFPGGLKGEKFKKTIKIASEKYGVEIKKTAFNPNIISDQLMAESEYIYCNQSFYEYEQGVYKRLDDIEVDIKTKEFLSEEYTKYRAEAVRHCIAVEKHIKNDILNSDRNKINLMNGIFDLKEMKIEEHSKRFISSIQLPIIYDKDATCPLWEKTLNEIFMGVEWKINCLQEFMGYCLTSDNSHQKALLNLGQGANGKSLIFRIQRTVLGHDNVSSVTIDNLSNRHYLAGLYGKLVNLSIESNAKESINESDFKAVVTGDPVTVDEKYGKPFVFEPFCKLIFSMNELPHIDDKTDAPYRRMLIIDYERQFAQSEQNRHLYNELLPEISGIFNWMVRGLINLNSRGHFDTNGDMQKLISEYKKDNNPVIYFIEETLEPRLLDEISKKNIYNRYCQWCKEDGYKPFSDKKLTKQIRMFYKKEIKKGDIKETRTGIGHNWKGLQFKVYKENEEGWEE